MLFPQFIFLNKIFLIFHGHFNERFSNFYYKYSIFLYNFFFPFFVFYLFFIKKSRLAHSTQNKALLMAFLSSVIRIWNFQNRNNRFTPCIKRIFPTFFALKCKNQVLCASRDSLSKIQIVKTGVKYCNSALHAV